MWDFFSFVRLFFSPWDFLFFLWKCFSWKLFYPKWKFLVNYKKGFDRLCRGPQGSKQYIFGDYFYSNNARKLRFHVFPLFHVRKHMTSSFSLKLTKLTGNCEFCSNCGSPGTGTKLEQIHNFLYIRSNSGKMMMAYVFYY